MRWWVRGSQTSVRLFKMGNTLSPYTHIYKVVAMELMLKTQKQGGINHWSLMEWEAKRDRKNRWDIRWKEIGLWIDEKMQGKGRDVSLKRAAKTHLQMFSKNVDLSWDLRGVWNLWEFEDVELVRKIQRDHSRICVRRKIKSSCRLSVWWVATS